jgi:hypothetical protein
MNIIAVSKMRCQNQTITKCWSLMLVAPLRVGVMGDVLAGLAVKNGWAGVVIHGAVRDSVASDE